MGHCLRLVQLRWRQHRTSVRRRHQLQTSIAAVAVAVLTLFSRVHTTGAAPPTAPAAATAVSTLTPTPDLNGFAGLPAHHKALVEGAFRVRADMFRGEAVGEVAGPAAKQMAAAGVNLMDMCFRVQSYYDGSPMATAFHSIYGACEALQKTAVSNVGPLAAAAEQARFAALDAERLQRTWATHGIAKETVAAASDVMSSLRAVATAAQLGEAGGMNVGQLQVGVSQLFHSALTGSAGGLQVSRKAAELKSAVNSWVTEQERHMKLQGGLNQLLQQPDAAVAAAAGAEATARAQLANAKAAQAHAAGTVDTLDGFHKDLTGKLATMGHEVAAHLVQEATTLADQALAAVDDSRTQARVRQDEADCRRMAAQQYEQQAKSYKMLRSVEAGFDAGIKWGPAKLLNSFSVSHEVKADALIKANEAAIKSANEAVKQITAQCLAKRKANFEHHKENAKTTAETVKGMIAAHSSVADKAVELVKKTIDHVTTPLQHAQTALSAAGNQIATASGALATATQQLASAQDSRERALDTHRQNVAESERRVGQAYAVVERLKGEFDAARGAANLGTLSTDLLVAAQAEMQTVVKWMQLFASVKNAEAGSLLAQVAKVEDLIKSAAQAEPVHTLSRLLQHRVPPAHADCLATHLASYSAVQFAQDMRAGRSITTKLPDAAAACRLDPDAVQWIRDMTAEATATEAEKQWLKDAGAPRADVPPQIAQVVKLATEIANTWGAAPTQQHGTSVSAGVLADGSMGPAVPTPSSRRSFTAFDGI